MASISILQQSSHSLLPAIAIVVPILIVVNAISAHSVLPAARKANTMADLCFEWLQSCLSIKQAGKWIKEWPSIFQQLNSGHTENTTGTNKDISEASESLLVNTSKTSIDYLIFYQRLAKVDILKLKAFQKIRLLVKAT